MKSFIKNIIIFIFGLLLLNLVFYLIVFENYLKPYQQVKLEFKTYLLSDSHGLPLGNTEKYGIYNFSASSDSYFDMRRKIKYLINNTEVDTIIISVDDHMLSPYRENLNNRDRSVYYAVDNDSTKIYDYIINTIIKKNIVLVNSKSRDVVKSYFKSKIFLILRIFTESKLNKPKISNLSDMSSAEQKILAKKRCVKQFIFNKPSKKLTLELNSIIKICNKNNIKLIGIKYPLSKIYIKSIGSRSFNSDSVFIEKSIKVVDFKVIEINDSLFTDSDHLSKVGGEYFLKLLVKEIRN